MSRVQVFRTSSSWFFTLDVLLERAYEWLMRLMSSLMWFNWKVFFVFCVVCIRAATRLLVEFPLFWYVGTIQQKLAKAKTEWCYEWDSEKLRESLKVFVLVFSDSHKNLEKWGVISLKCHKTYLHWFGYGYVVTFADKRTNFRTRSGKRIKLKKIKWKQW